MTRPRLALAGCLVACALAAACDAGSVAGNGGGDDDFPARIPSDDPSFDARLDALGIVCESSLTITGTFAPGDPAPDGHDGCWAVGTWTVEPAMDHVGCDPQPPILPEYTYDVTHPEDSTLVSFVNDPSDDRVNLKITTDGSNACIGVFEHFAPDFSVVNLRPILGDDGTLSGTGVFDFYDHDPF